MRVSKHEQSILAMCRLNKIFPSHGIKKQWKLGRLEIMFEWRSSENLWGRFGGGWNWVLGIQVGTSSVIINLLVCSLRFNLKSKGNKE